MADLRYFLGQAGPARLAALKAKREAEDDRSVCMGRAEILRAAAEEFGPLPRIERQAAVLRALCERIALVIEPEDIILGRMPEVVPTEEQEAQIEAQPELFGEPGLPGLLDSMSIYVPAWDWLLEQGLGGIGRYASTRADEASESAEERRFLCAAANAMMSVSLLLGRYAEAARQLAAQEATEPRRMELTAAADRCERVARDAPRSFIDALQLMQTVHMVLSCLVGGRDVTLGRMDQYLLPFYEADMQAGTLGEADARVLLAMFFLRLSQMAGAGTDFDDNVRRTPCKYTHLYVTIAGSTADGQSCVNALSFVVADAVRLLNYKEPTLLVRWCDGLDRRLARKVSAMARDRLPVTIYNDAAVAPALMSNGVSREAAYEYAHSACHNSIVPGLEAGSGPGAFHNAPRLLLLAMNAGRDVHTGQQAGAVTAKPEAIESFADLWNAFVGQVRFDLAAARRRNEQRWRHQYADACPLLPSCLMRASLDQRRPAWQAAAVSHLNHYFMGTATVVDSLLAVKQVVFVERELSLKGFVEVLRKDWRGREALRERIQKRLPRYGQDAEEARALTQKVGAMWVTEVRAAAAGMERLAMWPGFYSHLSHVRAGKQTAATPDGRRAGDALSENQAPSAGTPHCSPLSILRSMACLPLKQTPSGAAILSVSARDFAGAEGVGRLLSLIEGYFDMGGHHLHINAVDVQTLEAALKTPEHYHDLMVRVAGFSAYFTQLSEDAQQDVIRRHRRT